MFKILIMGLPGSGKTTLAIALKSKLEKIGKSVTWLNADHVRQSYNDWDFSYEGRIRQSKRMHDLANITETDYVIGDFVAPLNKMREIFDATIIVWIDTIKLSKFKDTNEIFEPPMNYDIRVTDYQLEEWCDKIMKRIKDENIKQ